MLIVAVMRADGGERCVEKEISNNLDTHTHTHTDQTQHITQVHPVDSHAEIKKM